MRVLSNKLNLLVVSIGLFFLLFQSCVQKTKPQITLDEISEISFDSAKITSNLHSNGGDSILFTGVCWSTMPNPTDSLDLSIRNDKISGVIISDLKDLIPGKTYYVRAFAKNSVGISYSEEKMFTTKKIKIGDIYQGGKVGYIFKRGDNGYIEDEIHGLIIGDPSDFVSYNGEITGNTGADLGLGRNNSYIIYGSNYSKNKYSPAAWCLNLNLNGYDDWFLPSIMELMAIYNNKKYLGLKKYDYGVSYDYLGNRHTVLPTMFWSSTESEWLDRVWCLFLNGSNRCNGQECTNDFRPGRDCHWTGMPINSQHAVAKILPMRTF